MIINPTETPLFQRMCRYLGRELSISTLSAKILTNTELEPALFVGLTGADDHTNANLS
jgi:hypothetical protein